MFDESKHPRDEDGKWAVIQAYADAANAHVDQAEAKARRIGRMFVRRARQEYANLRIGKQQGEDVDSNGRMADAQTAVERAVSDVVPGPMLDHFAGDVADAVAAKLADGKPGDEIPDEVWADAISEVREKAAQDAYNVGFHSIPEKHHDMIEKHADSIDEQLTKTTRVDAKKIFAKSIRLDRSMSDKAIILQARGTSPFVRLEADRLKIGDSKDVPIHYLRKEIIPLGETRVHPVKGYTIHVDRDRADRIVANTKLMLDRGRFIPAPAGHKNTETNYGKWLSLSVDKNDRGGESLFGVLQVVGDKTLEEVLNKDVSICTKDGVSDDKGNAYDGEVCDHIAVTHLPAISDLTGWTSIAASRGESMEVPVFELSATSESNMDIKVLRTALGAADSVPDADVLSQAVTRINAAKTAETTIVELTRERDDFKAKHSNVVLELDRAKPSMLDPEVIHVRKQLITDKVKALRGTPDWNKRAIALLVGDDAKPNTLMLSREAGSEVARAEEVLKLFSEYKAAPGDGEKTGPQILDLDRREPAGNGASEQAKEIEKAKVEGAEWQKQQQASRGLAA